jgi:hypothetical protein
VGLMDVRCTMYDVRFQGLRPLRILRAPGGL